MSTDRIVVARAAWDAEYSAGRWDYLANAIEQTRYDAIAREVMARYPHGTVVDLGCGYGLLRTALLRQGFSGCYQGVDWSTQVLESAEALHGPYFRCCDLNSFKFDGAPDVVVLSEVLYYLEQPLALIDQAYAATEACHGCVLISIYQPRISSQQGADVLEQLCVRLLASGYSKQVSQIVHEETGRSWRLLCADHSATADRTRAR